MPDNTHLKPPSSRWTHITGRPINPPWPPPCFRYISPSYPIPHDTRRRPLHRTNRTHLSPQPHTCHPVRECSDPYTCSIILRSQPYLLSSSPWSKPEHPKANVLKITRSPCMNRRPTVAFPLYITSHHHDPLSLYTLLTSHRRVNTFPFISITCMLASSVSQRDVVM